MYCRSMCIKDQLSCYLPALLQITYGLEGCGLMGTIRRYPEIWRPVFESGNIFTITAEEFLENLNADYSESQISKLTEVDCFKFFCDVIESMDTGKELLQVVAYVNTI